MDYINQIICGDCLEVMKTMPDNFIDTIITDPPYGLEFMGKEWDKFSPAIKKRLWRAKGYQWKGKSGLDNLPAYMDKSMLSTYQSWVEQWATETLRVAKPGATLLCFGGTRTYHRLACAIEDAGWILKDCIMWLYGSGFPKATDISKQLDKENRKIKFGIYKLQEKLNKRRIENDFTLRDINKLFGVPENSGCAAHKFCDKSQPQFPTRKQMKILDKTLGLNGELWELYDEVERKIIGKKQAGLGTGKTYAFTDNNITNGEVDITAPATPEATLWDGWKSHGLKPAYEPILVAMKPNEGSYANNALKWGVAGLNIDGGRIGTEEEIGRDNRNIKNSPLAPKDGWNENSMKGLDRRDLHKGRFPANIILDEEAGVMLDEQSGTLKSGAMKKPYKYTNNGYSLGKPAGETKQIHEANQGGASRFFYCAKASKSERNRGCEGLEEKREQISMNKNYVGSDGSLRTKNLPSKNSHPTVKPLALMKYLVTLTKTPTGGIVLDPFCGSGTTLMACKELKRDYIGIEKDKEYCEIAKRRIRAIPELLFKEVIK